MANPSTAPVLPPAPEQGQLVEVRHRRWIVSDVARGALPGNPLDLPDQALPQHLVSLSALDDDALGEDLQVIWELEPGARIIENLALPDPDHFDPPQRLAAFLDAVAWGAASTADVRALQSPFRAGIDIQDYQLDPVARAIRMPRVNLLIADDVGLGKTIEAGLVAQELLVRHRARRILVVCPSSLQVQWRDQMGSKFGLEFRIVDTELLRELRRSRGTRTNPWTHFPRLIASIDFLKRDRNLQRFREALPAEGEPQYPRRFDLLILDEAHNVAPAGVGKYARASLRTQAIRTLAPHFEHKLFLTATPHNGYRESFTALLEILDNQRFARGIQPSPETLEPAMVRRLKEDLPPNWDGSPRFPRRELHAIEVEYREDEREAHRWLKQYADLRHRSAREEGEVLAIEFVLKLLKKRLFSSPAAFLATLEQHEKSQAGDRRKRDGGAPAPSRKVLEEYLDAADEEHADDDEHEAATDEAVHVATRSLHEPSPAERASLKRLLDWARITRSRPDSKTQALLEWLEREIRPGGTWGQGRVILFTEYRATQKWLMDQLAVRGLTEGERVMLLYGGMPTDKREAIKAAFQASPTDSPVRILLATDAASEGIDLQNHCHRVVHLEIPWNPNRLEQRNGRIDRYGQKSNPLVFHFVSRGYQRARYLETRPGELDADLEFLFRAAVKIDQIRQDLGKVGPVIADQVEEAMLGRRSRLDTTQAEKDAAPVRRMLRFERDLRARIQALREQLDETRKALRLAPENIRHVVEIALEIAGQPPLIGGPCANTWRMPPLKGSWAGCTLGLEHPHTREVRPITFDSDTAAGRDDVVLVHLNHRLVQMSLRLLRAEVWKHGPHVRKGLQRVRAQLVPNEALDHPAVVAHSRLLVIGADRHRLHEELFSVGGTLREGRFQRMNVGDTARCLAAASAEEPAEAMKQRLLELYPNLVEPLLQALDTRRDDILKGVLRKLAERVEHETSSLTQVLEELRAGIERELKNPELNQLLLAPDMAPIDREEVERNRRFLERRVREIPAEIARETAALRERYSDVQARVFPVAISFLVPRKHDRG